MYDLYDVVAYIGPILGSHAPKQNIRSDTESNWKIQRRKKNGTAVNFLKSDNKPYLKKKQMSMLYFILKYTDKIYQVFGWKAERFRGSKVEGLKVGRGNLVKSEIMTSNMLRDNII